MCADGMEVKADTTPMGFWILTERFRATPLKTTLVANLSSEYEKPYVHGYICSQRDLRDILPLV
jgi:hypothetical protein